MAELAAMLPHRTGGLPAYACDSYKPLGETTARHVGGLSGWGYWLGWFPVAPINMILAAGYIAVLAHLPLGKSLLPLGSLGTAVTPTVLIVTLGTPRSPSARRDCTGSSGTSAPRWCSSACSVPRSRPSTR
jgi:amino acid transporter